MSPSETDRTTGSGALEELVAMDDAPDATAAVATAASSRRAQPLDEDLLDEIAAAIARLPEPLAAVAAGVEVARADGDATGVRKRLFELGIAVVRYSVSVALGQLAERLGESSGPRPLAEALQRAGRLSDGAWCALGRTAARQLETRLDRRVAAFAFLTRKPLADLVRARNHFVHGSGSGDDAPELVLALLADAEALLDWPLCAVVSLDPPSFEERRGVPLRPGVWRKQRKPLPTGVLEGVVYLVHDDGGQPCWTPVTPWLPVASRKVLLLDAPHAPGGCWRSVDVETGEHRECAELDAAMRVLVGQQSNAPVAPTERPSLVGRATAVAVMRRAAEIVQGGAVSVVLLTGPQGVGRGRLLEVVREAAPAFGLGGVLEASCLERRRGVFRPLRRAVESVEALAAARETMERAAQGDALAGAEALAAAVEAVEECLVEASLQDPLLLLLDDAQWADDPTLRLLSLLTDRATRRAPGRILVVVACRDEPTRRAELTALIGQVERDVGAGATRLHLEPLLEGDSRTLVRGVAPLAPALEERLVAGAAGLPFLLVQSVLAWAETGALSWEDGAWVPAHERVLTEPVPGVAELVQARIVSSFEPGSPAERCARHLLAAVGMAGAPLGVTEVEQVLDRLGSPIDAVERALEALVEAGLFLVSGPRHDVRFAQPMVRDAVVDSLRRKPWFPRLHRALLEVLAAEDGRGEDAAFIATGYLELGDVAAAIPWLERSIERAFSLGLFAEAAEQAERLVTVGRDAAERSRAGLFAVDALLRSGDARAARHRLQRCDAGASGEPIVRIRARILAISVAHALGEEADELDAVLLDDADRCADPVLALQARLVLAAVRRASRGLELIDEALARVESGGTEQPAELGYRLLALRCELLEETRAIDDPECRTALERARDAAALLESRWARIDADNDLAVLHSAAGDHARAIALMKSVAESAARERFGSLYRGALVNVATMLWRAGRSAEVVEAATRAAEACRRVGDVRLLSMALSVMADALLQLGDLAAARRAIDEAVELKIASGDKNVTIALLRRADVALAQADYAQAREDAAVALERAEQLGNHDQASLAHLWLGLLDLTMEGEAAVERVDALVQALSARRASLRAPTRVLLDRVCAALQVARRR